MSGGEMVVVRQGDTMVSIAHANGYRSWEVIYNHARNAELRRRCPDPTLLVPGLSLYLPEKGTATWTRPTGKRHVFKAKRLTARLCFTVGDEDRVFADARYELQVDGELRAGTTNGEGQINVEVSPAARTAHVTVWPDGDEGPPWEWTLRIGHLDPYDTDSGLRARLANLGYPPGEDEDGLRDALERFQFDHDLEVTGALDDRTRDLLQERSGA